MIKNTTTIKCISNNNNQMPKKEEEEEEEEEEPSNIIILNLRSQLKTHSKIKDLQSRVKNKGS